MGRRSQPTKVTTRNLVNLTPGITIMETASTTTIRTSIRTINILHSPASSEVTHGLMDGRIKNTAKML